MNENIFFPCVTVPNAKLRIFVFPHAGGSVSAYVRFKKILPPETELYIFEMPGRSRPQNLRLNTWAEIAQFVVDDLRALWDRPALFFGHSMGALVALTALQYLGASPSEAGRYIIPPPGRLLVSAMNAPLANTQFGTHGLAQTSDEDFMAGLKLIGGLPEEFLLDPATLAFLLTPVRQDLALLDQFPKSATIAKVTVPITSLLPMDDRLCDRKGLTAWQKFTSGEFQFRFVKGGHFYLLSDLNFIKKLFYDESMDLRKWGEA